MKVVGEAEEGDWLFIIAEDSLDAELMKPTPMVRVLRRSEKWLMRPMTLHSLVKQGNFEPAELPAEELRVLLSDLRRVDGPGVDEPWVPTGWAPSEAERRRYPHLFEKRMRPR